VGINCWYCGAGTGSFLFLIREVLKKIILSKLSPRQSTIVIVIILTLIRLISFYGIFDYWFLKNDSGSVTILVHGEKGKDELILPGRGIVRLIYGTACIFTDVPNLIPINSKPNRPLSSELAALQTGL
jgi:hypothetical protein